MFGTNIILKQVHDKTLLNVHSIFPTIQGEGPFAGRASVFVRLHGCSLACSWCDTEFEKMNRLMSVRDLIESVNAAANSVRMARPPLIVITGGEPMRQNLVDYLLALVQNGNEVQIETAGIHWEDEYEDIVLNNPVYIICSPKTHKLHHRIAHHASALKYIIDARELAASEDGLPAMAVSQRGQPPTSTLWRPKPIIPSKVYVQPLDEPRALPEVPQNGAVSFNTLHAKRCVDLVLRYGYRLSLQQHKILDLE